MVMKKVRIITTVILIFLMGFSAKSQEYQNAVGIRFSSNAAAINNSITFKHFVNNNTAIEGLFSFGAPVAIGVLLEKHTELATEGLSYFLGGGGYVGFSGSRNLGAQGVAGLEYKFPTVPINVSVDWKPELNIINHISFEPAVLGISARFVF